MVRVVGIHHLSLVTGSLDRTLRFWRDLVGLQVRCRLGAPGYRQYFLAAGGQTLLSFFEWPGAEPVPEKDHGVPVEFSVAVEAADVRTVTLLRIASPGRWRSRDRSRNRPPGRPLSFQRRRASERSTPGPLAITSTDARNDVGKRARALLEYKFRGRMSLPSRLTAGKELVTGMRNVRTLIALGAVLISLETQAGAADGGVQGAEKPAVKAPGGVVARVNGVGLSESEFDRNWEYFLQRSGIPADHAGKDGSVDEFRKQVLDRLIDEELLFQEAKIRKMLVGKEAVDLEIEKARAQFPTPEAFTEALTKNKLTEASLRGIFSRNLSIQAFVENVVAKGVAVSDAEVHDFYAGNKDKFEAPEQARARHILVSVDEKADEKTRQAGRAKADELLVQLKGGANFEELARKSSDCPSAPQGGDLGLFGHGQMVPEFDAAVFALKPGELSAVVTTKFGYHIIKLEEKKDAGLVPETDVAPRIREYLVSQKTGDAVEQNIKTLREKAKIELVMKP